MITVGVHLELEQTSVLKMKVFVESTVVFIISVDNVGKRMFSVLVKLGKAEELWLPVPVSE